MQKAAASSDATQKAGVCLHSLTVIKGELFDLLVLMLILVQVANVCM